jgi:hypothetical protein
MIEFRVGDEIEIVDVDTPEDVRRAIVAGFMSDKGQGMSPEIEDYIACWIEVRLDGVTGDIANQMVMMGTDSHYWMNGRHILLRKA